MILPNEAGGDLGGVAPCGLLHGEVGGDHRVAVGYQPGVQQLIQGGLDELGGQLAAQVVQNEQVTGEVPPGLVQGGLHALRIPLELPGLKLGEDVACGVVHHRAPLLGHRAGDAGGQEGLAQSGRAGEKQVFEIEAAKFLGVVQTHLIHQVHVVPGRGAPSGPYGLPSWPPT